MLNMYNNVISPTDILKQNADKNSINNKKTT